MDKRRVFSILLSIALIFGMMPALGLPVYADDPVEQSEAFDTTINEYGYYDEEEDYTYEGKNITIAVTAVGDGYGFILDDI